MVNFLKKILYYSDFCLLWEIFIAGIKIQHTAGDKLLSLADPVPKGIKRKEKLIRYVNAVLLIRRRLGARDVCLFRSILTCRILRRYGYPDKVTFAAKKENNKLTGHCWVEGINPAPQNWQILFNYPEKETVKG